MAIAEDANMGNVRKLALSLLTEWENGDKFINLMLETPAVLALPTEDKRFLTALLYGTVERLITLDYCISRLSDRPAQGMAPHTRRLLRLGLYQLLYMPGVPPHAAVNETVALCGSRGERGFVNAVLRTAIRTPEKYAMPERTKDPETYLSLAYAFPRSVVRLLSRQYGEEMCEAILARYNDPPALTLRVNTQKTDRDSLLAALASHGYGAEPTPYAPYGIRLTASANPKDLPGFAEGLFYVQDEASQIAVCALGAKAPARVIDTCACPGGKSFGISIAMHGEGEVLSFDLHESKLSLITDGAARLGLSNIYPAVHNGEEARADLLVSADYVLCDAPCSGLGVLGKKADLRHRAGGREGLPPLQLRILTAAAQYVKPGGTLVYSTCTLNRAENEDVVQAFLAENPAFHLEPFSVGDLRAENGMLTLLPPIHKTDGFFISKLIQD